ncbi:MAG: hypothetical protein PHI01_05710, partial [Candidatus Izemoplasmatales bacterium]|nr:hypothetical protein [Candidatus Izemoplasmatales bacterium]
ILDEPTNHLDIYTRTIIEDVFQSFSGPIIFVSHDRYFINKVASKLLVMDDGESLYFEGNYDAYKEYQEKQSEKTASKHKTEPSQKSSKPSPAKIEAQIEEKTREIEKLRSSLFEPEVYMEKATYEEVQERIHKLEKETMTLFAQIET